VYEKERLPVATEYVQKTTLRNKAMLEQNDSIARKARQKELSAVASNPMKAREYLLESSMIASFKN
jgi:3-(3-hydroxy-phenyl)propionate hydroxylase